MTNGLSHSGAMLYVMEKGLKLKIRKRQYIFRHHLPSCECVDCITARSNELWLWSLYTSSFDYVNSFALACVVRL